MNKLTKTHKQTQNFNRQAKQANKMHRIFLKLMKKYGLGNVKMLHDEIIVTVKDTKKP